MSREWVDAEKRKPVDRRWVMRCDLNSFGPDARCTTESEPRRDVNDLSLERFAAEGWFIAEKHGDLCPKCLAEGHVPSCAPAVIEPGS